MSRAAKANARTRGAAATSAKKGAPTDGAVVAKDSQIARLKSKVAELRDLCAEKSRELEEMTKTIKYTRIVEFEQELAANVNEARRLQQLLEAELATPKLDAATMQRVNDKLAGQGRTITALKKQIEMHEATNGKLSRKIEVCGRKVQRLRDTKRKINLRNKRLDRHVKMLKT